MDVSMTYNMFIYVVLTWIMMYIEDTLAIILWLVK